jgi:hypothetical protein
MMRQRWRAGAGALLALLVLTEAARAEEAAAVQAILQLGGTVKVDAKQPGKPVVVVCFNSTQVTDAGLKELKAFKGLEILDLAHTHITDQGLKELKDLKTLQALRLHDTPVTDEGLKELKDLKNLQTLDLGKTRITDKGLKELKDLKSLRTLSLFGTQVTGAAVKELQAALPELMIVATQQEQTEADRRESFGSCAWQDLPDNTDVFTRPKPGEDKLQVEQIARNVQKSAIKGQEQADRREEELRKLRQQQAEKDAENEAKNKPWPFPFGGIQVFVKSPGGTLLGLAIGVPLFLLLLALNKVKWMTKEIHFPGSFLIDWLIALFKPRP